MAAAIAIGAFQQSVVYGQPSTAPNIVFILADDLGYGDLGVTGQTARAAQGLPSFATPNIDSIAQAGMQFKNMYTGAPSCTPSRLSLLTGFSQGHTMSDQAQDNFDIRGGEQDKTWGQVMQQAGYETGIFGKWHQGGFEFNGTVRAPGALPNAKGFEQGIGNLGAPRVEVHWEIDETTGYAVVPTPLEPTWPGPGAPREYLDNIVAKKAADFIGAKSNAAQPFLAYVPLTGPHTPYAQVPQDHPYVNMPWGKSARDYAGMVYYLDKQVGQILAAIDDPNGDGDKSDSVADNTIVIFASDNGPALADANGYSPTFFGSNGGYWGAKFLSSDGGIRTPFLVRWPEKLAAGTVNNSFVGSFADIMPTFAELAGQDAPLGIDGRSMLSELTGQGPSERPDVLVWNATREIGAANPGNFAVRVGDWKLMKRMPTTADPNVTYRLYNMSLDPGELTDRSAARPDIVAALTAIGYAEGYDREPIGPIPTVPTINETKNTYFTQYKSWAPASGSADFFSAGNWSGGTRYNQSATSSADQPPEAIGWNTGPVDNWLAVMANDTSVNQSVDVSQNAKVLALGLAGASRKMQLNVMSGVQLSARNGFRISQNGILRLKGGELNTVRTLEIRQGGELQGSGLITGQQSVVANIPEFANRGLFAPEVINDGLLTIEGGFNANPVAGQLTIDGDYVQSQSGTIHIDLFSKGGNGGVDFDKLTISGSAEIAGALSLSFAPSLSPALGDVFNIITAGNGLSGMFSSILGSAPGAGLAWKVEYSNNMAQLKVIAGPGDYLATWKAAFGVSGAGDLDGDGDTDGNDFLVWQRQTTSPPSATSTAAVPEPASILLLTLAAAAGFRMSRASRR